MMNVLSLLDDQLFSAKAFSIITEKCKDSIVEPWELKWLITSYERLHLLFSEPRTYFDYLADLYSDWISILEKAFTPLHAS